MSNIYFAGSGGGGLDPDDCTATPAQVLEGHTAGVNGNDDPVEGTMPYQKQEGTLNCGQSSIILPGYHDGTRSITANSLASQTPGTASAANIYPGKTAWVNGNKVTGTMATQGGGTYTAGTADKTVVPANRFVTGNVVVKGDANLTAGNIKKGVKIMGITGSWEGWVVAANDLYSYGNNLGNLIHGRSIMEESGMIAVRYGSTSTGTSLVSQKQYNLAGYTKLSMLANIVNVYSNHSITAGYGASAADNLYYDNFGTKEKLNTGNQTLVWTFSGLNITKCVGITFRGTPTIYIYKIWLS
ncbi:hypothetical protein [Enterocloster asparagiformis]|uniref:hypothetical protein n=2 Tax=Enterocloster asparagiformis TaxID=333367 RepID=UPI002A816F65|nr:hypothetical protein [Enterocloster asparagiformis]